MTAPDVSFTTPAMALCAWAMAGTSASQANATMIVVSNILDRMVTSPRSVNSGAWPR